MNQTRFYSGKSYVRRNLHETEKMTKLFFTKRLLTPNPNCRPLGLQSARMSEDPTNTSVLPENSGPNELQHVLRNN
jgi:hypothetical protein